MEKSGDVDLMLFPLIDCHEDFIEADELNALLFHFSKLVFAFEEADAFEHFFELVQSDAEALGGPEVGEWDVMKKEVLIEAREEDEFGRGENFLEGLLVILVLIGEKEIGVRHQMKRERVGSALDYFIMKSGLCE